MPISRREVLKSTGVGLGSLAAALAAGGDSAGDEPRPAPQPMPEPEPRTGGGLPAGWRALRKFDVHNHVPAGLQRPNGNWGRVEDMIEAAEALGIEKLCCSNPIAGGALVDIQKVRDANDSVLAAMKRHPDRIAGFAFVQPGNGPEALAEIERCLDAGMIGVKLYNQFKYSDPVVFPIAERCIARRIPLLGHSGHVTDPKTRAAQPRTSDSLDFRVLSLRYPELMLILGHVNGGGDWEWAVKGLRDCPSVYLDTGGSVQEDDTIGTCVRELGHRRVLFATDQTMEGCVGKVLSADLTAEQREDIFWRNLQGILDRRRS